MDLISLNSSWETLDSTLSKHLNSPSKKDLLNFQKSLLI